MGWLPVAISMIASDLSAISYIGVASWAYKEDSRIAFGMFVGPFL